MCGINTMFFFLFRFTLAVIMLTQYLHGSPWNLSWIPGILCYTHDSLETDLSAGIQAATCHVFRFTKIDNYWNIK